MALQRRSPTRRAYLVSATAFAERVNFDIGLELFMCH
jgi:hypothetical protein